MEKLFRRGLRAWLSGSSSKAAHQRVINKAKELGASLAGIVSLKQLLESPSRKTESPEKFSSKGRSVIVLALAHKESHPDLDWWDLRKGGTEGNGMLRRIALELIAWLQEDMRIDAHLMPYHLHKGGVYLKDAAVLAGLGTIGKNNLLVCPSFGPRVRLRALLLDEALTPSKTLDSKPCECLQPTMHLCMPTTCI